MTTSIDRLQSPKDLNVLVLVKGDERYCFMYHDDQGAEVQRVMGRFASDPELRFTWYDAAILSQRVRKQTALPDKGT